MARRLFIDIDSGRLVGGLQTGLAPALDNLFEADNAEYELFFVEPGADRAFDPVDYSARSVTLALAAPPPSGTIYAATTGWSNLPSTVTAAVVRAITGGPAVNERQTLTLEPEAVDGTFSLTFPSKQLTFSALSAGVFTTSGAHGLSTLQPFVATGFSTPSGFSNGQTLYAAVLLTADSFFANSIPTAAAVTAFSAATPGSAYTITATTPSLSARIAPTQVQSALQGLAAIGEDNVVVEGRAGRVYRIDFVAEKSQITHPLLTVAGTLTPAPGKSATLNLNTTALVNAISASASIEAVLEIETAESGIVETVLQVPVTLRNDVIGTNTPAPITAASTFELLDGAGGTWAVSIDPDGILTATKQ